MEKPPTFRDIAKLANVSVAAVSLAVNNRPGVSQATRQHVLEVARACGYRFNPFVTALMEQKRSYRDQPIHAIIGIVTPARLDSSSYFPHSTSAEFLLGAGEAAERLGFALEQFTLPELKRNSAKIRTAMHTRRMNGLIVHHVEEMPDWIDLDWSQFAVVSIGQRMHRPCFDFTASDHYENMRLCVTKLRELGYKKIGFTSPREWESMRDDRYLSAFLGMHWAQPVIPPFLPPESQWGGGVLGEWLRHHKPDVIVSTDHKLLEWMRDLDLRVPEQVGFAHLDLDVTWAGSIAGIQQGNRQVGSAAVYLVASRINRLDFGVPATPHGQLVEGAWVNGPTLRC